MKPPKHTHRVSHVQRYNAKNRRPELAGMNETIQKLKPHAVEALMGPPEPAKPKGRPKLLTPAEMTLKLRASSRQRVIVIDEKKENPT